MPWIKVEEKESILFHNENSTEGTRVLNYVEALREAFFQACEYDSRVIAFGEGINDKVGMFGVTTGAKKQFGEERIFDVPIAEAGMMGVTVGAALEGLRPVYCHNRPDFLMLGMDQIVNHASKMCYMSGGVCNVPCVIWAVTSEGWGSAAQHSQSVQGMFANVPGLKIIMPSNPYDVKGMFLSAVADNNPVLFLDHRSVYQTRGNVPEKLYKVPLSKAKVVRTGMDVTIVAFSKMVIDALKAAEVLEREGIECEVIDLRTIKPYDKETILSSVKKTGRLVVADTTWKTYGTAAEIVAMVCEDGFSFLKSAVIRVACEDVPVPAGYTLEEFFYKNEKDIVQAVKQICRSDI